METPSGSTTLDVEFEQFRREIRKYSFFQANRLLERFAEMSEDGPVNRRYRGKKSLAFPVADIDEVLVQETPSGKQIELVVTFMGLYGPSSPLPAYYTERLLHTDDDSEAMRQFIDLFNHQVIKNFQTVWEKYRYYIQYSGGQDRLSGWIRELSGLPDNQQIGRLGLEWQKLFRLTPLLTMNIRNGDSLVAFLEGYFDTMTFTVEECVERSVLIPEDQRHHMGTSNMSLGMDIVMGEVVQDRMGKFRVHILDFGAQDPGEFYPGGSSHNALYGLISLFLRDQCEFDVSIRREAGLAGEYCLSETGARMGWNAMLGDVTRGVGEEVLIPHG